MYVRCCKNQTSSQSRSTYKVIGPQSYRSPNCGNFKTLGTKCHLDVGFVEKHRVHYKGEGDGFPEVWAVVNLVNLSCPCLVLTPKVLQLCINHLVLVLRKFVWIVDTYHLSFFVVSSWSSSTPLQNVANHGACPDFLLFYCFQFRLAFESIKELGAHHECTHMLSSCNFPKTKFLF